LSVNYIRLVSLIGILIFSSLLISTTVFSSSSATSSSGSLQFPVDSGGSWNPKVPCSSPWIVRITDITDNATGTASYNSSIFNPGITPPKSYANKIYPGNIIAWLTNATGDSLPRGWVSPGPSCTVTNSKGQIVGAFVEIDGVKRAGLTNEGCAARYGPLDGGGTFPNGETFCNYTFNIYDPSVVSNYATSCSNSTDPTCYGRMHVIINRDWLAAGYCGPGTPCDNTTLGTTYHPYNALFDIQGFVYWGAPLASVSLNQSWHNYIGWEINPLTAWRVHSNSSTADTPHTNQFQLPLILEQFRYYLIAAPVSAAVAGTILMLIRKHNKQLFHTDKREDKEFSSSSEL
jgi:hypothetical protein